MKDGARIGRPSTVNCVVYSSRAEFVGGKLCTIFVPHTLITEPGMNCIISGPSVHGRGREFKKSYRWPDMVLYRRSCNKATSWMGYEGGDSPRPKIYSSKNLLWGWWLSFMQAPHFWLRCSSGALCLMKHYQHPVFPVRSLPNMLIPSSVVALSNSGVLTSDHHNYTCHCMLVYSETQEHYASNFFINIKSIMQ